MRKRLLNLGRIFRALRIFWTITWRETAIKITAERKAFRSAHFAHMFDVARNIVHGGHAVIRKEFSVQIQATHAIARRDRSNCFVSEMPLIARHKTSAVGMARNDRALGQGDHLRASLIGQMRKIMDHSQGIK